MSDNQDYREMGERREKKEPPSVEHMFTLKIDNISSRVTQFGSTEPRGYAFVRFIDKNAAEDAMRSLNETEFEGLTIRVQEAKARRPDNPRQFYARRGGGGGGGRGGYSRDSYRRDSRDRRDYRDGRDFGGRDYRDYRPPRDDYRGAPEYSLRERPRSRSRDRYGGDRARSRSRSNGRRY